MPVGPVLDNGHEPILNLQRKYHKKMPSCQVSIAIFGISVEVLLTSSARNDGNPKTMNFLTSPELTTAMTFVGSMEFNPMTDSIRTPSGKEFKFEPPSGESLPVHGFDSGTSLSPLSPSDLKVMRR
jgi:hypothetical protein